MKRNDKVILSIICLAIFGAIGAYLLNFHNAKISNDTLDWGNFGGYIGGTLSLISVFLIYYTYRKQSEMNYRNQFESIFFEMLNRQREIYRDINGCKLFFELRAEIETHFQTSFDGTLTKEDVEKLLTCYFDYHIYFKKYCLHYFRHLYSIIKYVHFDRIISNSEKKKYIDMIQTEMNDNELFIFLLNCVWWNFKYKKENNYLTWLDDYSFFENLQSPGEWFDICKKVLFKKTKWKHFVSVETNNDIDIEEVNCDQEQWYNTLDRLHGRIKAAR